MPLGTDFFVTFVDIPLCIWYLSFYCSPATKFAVIGKILFLAFDNSSYRWADYIEKYIHTEDEIASINIFEKQKNYIRKLQFFKGMLDQ